MKTGVIGCGKMATALVGGAIQAGTLEAAKVLGFDPSKDAGDAFVRATGATRATSLAELASCDLLLLCTKPHQVCSALTELGQAQPDPALLISVAAGVSLADLEKTSPPSFRVIRCMPNTPALVGEGASAFAVGSQAGPDDAEIARQLLGSVGIVHEVTENLLDAVTGLSGSGPAYVFLMIEALADGAVRCGLPRAQALEMAAQTLRGAASMVLQTGDHPAVLKDRVASPGGTTIAGLAALEAGGLRAALIDAVAAAAHRSKELGKP
jgi:pyrroline-5-carboxylate reductase